jgi:peptide chain release factor 2
MEELQNRAESLAETIKNATQQIHLSDLVNELGEARQAATQPDFWNDNLAAQATMKQIAKLEARTGPWLALQKEVADAQELLQLRDGSMESELAVQLGELESRFDALKSDLMLTGPYDDHDTIVSVHAGAGGTDAQDWAGMLLRMYVRFCEQHDLDVQIIDESPGEEAGLKSATLEISGPQAYGKLKGEHGVHRLVRLSPFNSDNLRQTSFAKVEVMPKIDQPDDLLVDDKDLKVDVFRSGGHGGQSVNTTDSAVRITHLPTNIVVVIQNERSQLQNRETAMTILRSRLAQLQLEQHKETLSELKGPNEQAAWGNQIRSYVLHPYKQVKDLRSRYETSDAEGVLDGKLNPFIDAYLEYAIGKTD